MNLENERERGEENERALWEKEKKEKADYQSVEN